jgi:bifunctional non-homologous end joining protein LigD
MEPNNSPKPPSGENWLYQIKYDGIRLLCWIEHDRYRLFTRKQQARHKQYPEFRHIHQLIHATSLVLDGEVIVRDQQQKPQFSLILQRDRCQRPEQIDRLQHKLPIEYQVFDLLMYEGHDLRHEPLHKRIDRLHQVVKPNQWLQLVQSETDGSALLQQMKKRQWEGIVSKQTESPYLLGKQHQAWFKTKLKHTQLCVLGGVQLKAGRPNAVLLGLYLDEKLYYIGKLASGLTNQDLSLLHHSLSDLAQVDPPFVNPPQLKLPVCWFHPQLTLWVEYSEWTEAGRLRHPRLYGFATHPPHQARLVP